MLVKLLAFVMKLGLGGVADKALAHMERRLELANESERLKSETTVALAKEAVAEAKIMAEFNTAKLEYRPFWVLLFLVSAPFVIWEWAVVMDGLPYVNRVFGAEQVADLPTPALQEAFAAMIQWVFFVGTGVGGVKALMKR